MRIVKASLWISARRACLGEIEGARIRRLLERSLKKFIARTIKCIENPRAIWLAWHQSTCFRKEKWTIAKRKQWFVQVGEWFVVRTR